MTSPGQNIQKARGEQVDIIREAQAMTEEASEMVRQVSRVLGPQRWQPRADPFAGFGSPPGRF